VTLQISSGRLQNLDDFGTVYYASKAFERVIEARSAHPPVFVGSGQLRAAAPTNDERFWQNLDEDAKDPVVMAPNVRCQCRGLEIATLEALKAMTMLATVANFSTVSKLEQTAEPDGIR
jgi:hypothetical protein